MFVNKFRINNIILDQSMSVIKGMVFILLGVNSFVKMNSWDCWQQSLQSNSDIPLITWSHSKPTTQTSSTFIVERRKRLCLNLLKVLIKQKDEEKNII